MAHWPAFGSEARTGRRCRCAWARRRRPTSRCGAATPR